MTVPSLRSTNLRVSSDACHPFSVFGASVVSATAALNLFAVLHMFQCVGIFPGASASRTPTGVRSPYKYIEPQDK